MSKYCWFFLRINPEAHLLLSFSTSTTLSNYHHLSPGLSQWPPNWFFCFQPLLHLVYSQHNSQSNPVLSWFKTLQCPLIWIRVKAKILVKVAKSWQQRFPTFQISAPVTLSSLTVSPATLTPWLFLENVGQAGCLGLWPFWTSLLQDIHVLLSLPPPSFFLKITFLVRAFST